MTSATDPLLEVRRLTDALFDGELEAVGMARLESLIDGSNACLHAYIERVDFHGELVEQADPQTNRQATIGVLSEFADACSRQESRRVVRWSVSMAVMTSLAVAVFGLLVFKHSEVANEITTTRGPVVVAARIGEMILDVAEDGADVSVDDARMLPVLVGLEISLGDEVREFHLRNGVRCNVTGPARLTFSSVSEAALEFGSLVANVPTQAVGFTVKTPDMRVVDLGTTFGVSFDLGGVSQVHVFQGLVSASPTIPELSSTPMLLRAGEGVRLAYASRPSDISGSDSHFDPNSRPSGLPVVERVDGTVAPERFTSGLNRLQGIQKIIGKRIRLLTSPSASLRPGALVSDKWLSVIPERRAVILPEDMRCISPDHGLLDAPEKCVEETLPAGTRCRSVLLHAQSLNQGQPWHGELHFRQPILGILISSPQLFESDSIFGLAETDYPSWDDVIDQHLSRGALIPFRDIGDAGDQIEISANRLSIKFSLNAGQGNLDQIRVLLREDPIPTN